MTGDDDMTMMDAAPMRDDREQVIRDGLSALERMVDDPSARQVIRVMEMALMEERTDGYREE